MPKAPLNEPEKTPKRRGGAQKGSMHALKNGSRLRNRRLVVGELPSKMVAVKREGRKYRRELEAEIIEAKGVISLTDAHLIDTAAAATVFAGICRWLLRNKLDKMSPTDIRSCSADVVKAKQKRDAAVKALELDTPPPSPWAMTVPAKVIELKE